MAQISFEAKPNSNTFCDTGPDIMTSALAKLTNGQSIPQYCIPNPVGGGQARCYYLFVPDCATGPVPLVMNAHGGASCPVWNTYYDRWTETAMKYCFAVFYPIGVIDPTVAEAPCYSVPGGRNVNGLFTTMDCCCLKDGHRVDPIETRDLETVQHMIQDIVWNKRVEAQSIKSKNENNNNKSNNTDYNNNKNTTTTTSTTTTASVDETRIYLGGHSNGCVMALGMAAYFSNMVAAVSCHAGGAFVAFPSNYQPIPTILIQGMKDDAIWYQFARETYKMIGEKHKCYNDTFVSIDPNRTGVEYTEFNCTDNATVKLILLNESGHIPYANGFEISEGASVTTVDTTEMAYLFMSNYSKDAIPTSLVPSNAARLSLSLLLPSFSKISSSSNNIMSLVTITTTLVIYHL